MALLIVEWAFMDCRRETEEGKERGINLRWSVE